MLTNNYVPDHYLMVSVQMEFPLQRDTYTDNDVSSAKNSRFATEAASSKVDGNCGKTPHSLSSRLQATR